MRVALFTETYTPEVNGVVEHVKTLRNGLEKLGHEVLVITADKHCKHHYIEDNVLHCPSIEVKKIYGFGVASPYSRKRLKLIQDFAPDIMHIHHEFGIGLSGLMAARMQRKPLVYTLHTMYDQYIYYIAPRLLLRAATKFSHQYERFIADNATILTGPSQKGAEYFKKIGVKKEMNLIPNSADLDAFDPRKIMPEEKAELRRKLRIPEDSMVACFVGRLAKEKSIDVLLEFWANTITPEDHMHLLIIGDGPDRDALSLLAEGLGIDGMVRFTGRVNHQDMPVHYAICDVFATASLSEMNSISMLEGMASGLPVLQRYDELNADQIQSGVNGYLFRTADEMAAQLREIRAMSSEELEQLKTQVRETVDDRGSTDLARYMLGIYEKALETKESSMDERRKPYPFLKIDTDL